MQLIESIAQMNLKFSYRFMTNSIHNPHLLAMDRAQARAFEHIVYAILIFNTKSGKRKLNSTSICFALFVCL